MRRPPTSNSTETPFPYTTLVRSAVTGRSRVGAGRVRTDAQEPPGVHPGDGAAAGPNRMNRDGRHAEVIARPLRTQPGVAREFDGAVAHEAHIEGRAPEIGRAHV